MISLRTLTSHDIDYFYVWASDPDVAKTMRWSAYTSVEDGENFLKEVAEKHTWFKAICLEGIPVGSITLTHHSPICAELGYVLAKAYWRKGIATKAVKLALETGFTDLNIQRIEAFVDPTHMASRRVLEKAGFILEGQMDNRCTYALVKSR